MAASTATAATVKLSKFVFSRALRPYSLHSKGGSRMSDTVRAVSAMADSTIQLYSVGTPNGQKVGIALEEMGLPYEAHTIDIRKGDQLKPEFLAINPNGKIPAIVDPSTKGPDGTPLRVFESGAILLYLAEKSGKFFPLETSEKWEGLAWLFFQVGGPGPMFGQLGHFARFAKDKCDHPYPTERYTNESKRLLGVMEERLDGRDFFLDYGYSIVDMALVPWVNGVLASARSGTYSIDVSSFPRVNAWVERVLARPATARGMKVTPFP